MKLGCLPRAFNPHVPHLSALLAGKPAPAPPTAVDWTTKLPASLGMMGNDALGDCTCAALYHAVQVWSSVARERVYTEGDLEVRTLYEQACGYNPNDPATDQGGVEQDVLTYAVKNGIPVWPNASARHHLRAFVELDPRNVADLNYATYACGLLYIGFNVPQYLMENLAAPGSVWDVSAQNGAIVGGHAVITPGYLANGNRRIISWGSANYQMTPAFWSTYVTEVYALIDPLFIQTTGLSPLGMTIEQWDAQMVAIKQAA